MPPEVATFDELVQTLELEIHHRGETCCDNSCSASRRTNKPRGRMWRSNSGAGRERSTLSGVGWAYQRVHEFRPISESGATHGTSTSDADQDPRGHKRVCGSEPTLSREHTDGRYAKALLRDGDWN